MLFYCFCGDRTKIVPIPAGAKDQAVRGCERPYPAIASIREFFASCFAFIAAAAFFPERPA